MDRNDYDIDFDFEKELGIDPREFTDSAQGDDFDLSEYQNLDIENGTQDDLDLSQFDVDGDYADFQDPSSQDFEDFDLDGINLDDVPMDDVPMDEELYYEEQPQRQPFEEEEDEILRRPRREEDPSQEPQYEEEQYDSQDYGQEEDYPEDGEYPEEGEYAEEGEYPEEGEFPEDGEYPEEEAYPEEEETGKKSRPKPKKPRREIKIKKPTMPPIFQNIMAVYFGPAIAELTGMNPEPEGRRRRSKSRVFKEVYLPPIILLAAFVMVLTCIFGSLSHVIQRKMASNEADRQESIAASEEENRLQGEYVMLMDQADEAAMQYDFDKAVQILDSYSGEPPQDMVTKRAEFMSMSSKMVEWKDPAGIPNLSFHSLVADPARAYANKDLGGKYNQNFVTIDEFQKILDSLYANNYVLVDFDSFIETSETLDGVATFSIKPILLPEDKKPVMITETLVNYYDYMIDSNKDGKPDAGGAGFASRLVVDANGDIKAEMVDKDGNTVVGDYDLVPILETFLKTHPDFSYRGSKAILAPTGEQGIFGYRVQTAVISDAKFGQDYYNEQVQGAKALVQALRDKGYTMASYTFANRNYGQDNANQITEDLQSWDTQITPVIGNTNIMVFAQGSDIGDYTGTKFKALKDKGFQFFIGQSDKPFIDVSNSYVRQKRLMVTGSNMFWNGKMFTGMFDTATVLNPLRGDVPKAK